MIIFTGNLADLVPIFIIGIAILSVITIGLLVVLLILQNIVSGYFSAKKFAVKSKHKVEPLTGSERFELMVFNNNVNEARILSFGFLYRSNSIDFFQTYLEKEKVAPDTKVIITSRDFIKLEIEAIHLHDLIGKHNDGAVRVEAIQAYVTDIAGNIIKYPAREVRKIVYRHFKGIDDVKKAAEKAKRQEANRIKNEAFFAKFKKQPKPAPEVKPEPEPKVAPTPEPDVKKE